MFHVLLKHYKLIIVWACLVAVLSLVISFILPKQYSAASQLLIISRDRSGVDPYTQAKAAERIGDDLVQVMQTTDFYGKVMNLPAGNFAHNYWAALSDRDARKNWTKNVQGSVVYGTSLLNVTVYGATQEEAVNLSQAVDTVLSSQGFEYVGGDVAIKQVMSPLASRLPARPNFILNAILGFILGAVLCGLWVVKYKKHLFGV